MSSAYNRESRYHYIPFYTPMYSGLCQLYTVLVQLQKDLNCMTITWNCTHPPFTLYNIYMCAVAIRSNLQISITSFSFATAKVISFNKCQRQVSLCTCNAYGCCLNSSLAFEVLLNCITVWFASIACMHAHKTFHSQIDHICWTCPSKTFPST